MSAWSTKPPPLPQVADFLGADDAAQWARKIFAPPTTAPQTTAADTATAAAMSEQKCSGGLPAALRQLAADEHPDVVASVLSAHPLLKGPLPFGAKLAVVATWPPALRQAALHQALPVCAGEHGVVVHLRGAAHWPAILAKLPASPQIRWAQLMGPDCPPAVPGATGDLLTAPMGAPSPAVAGKRRRSGVTMASTLAQLPRSVQAVSIHASLDEDAAAVSRALSALSLTRLTLHAAEWNDGCPSRGTPTQHVVQIADVLNALQHCDNLEQLVVEPCEGPEVHLPVLARSTRLTCLHLRPGKPDRGWRLSEALITGLSGLERLRALDLNAFACTSEAGPGLAQAIAGMRSLASTLRCALPKRPLRALCRCCEITSRSRTWTWSSTAGLCQSSYISCSR